MTPWLVSSQEWLVRSSLAGGALLLLGVGLMFFTPQPARRQRIGELSLACSLLVALLCALPAWTPWSLPLWSTPIEPAAMPQSEPLREIIVLEEPHKLLALASRPGGALPVGETADVGALSLNARDELAAPPAETAERSDAESRWLVSLAQLWLIVAPWLVCLYVLATLAFFLRCALGFVGLRRLWRQCETPPPHIRALLESLTDGWPHRPRLGVSTRITLPVSFGLFKPTILIPWSFCRPIKHDDLRQVLVHELTHLQRLDAWSCLLLAVGQVVYFHLPWFWWLRKQVRLCQEYVADAAAAALSTTEDYAEYLVSLSGYAAPRLPVGAKVMGVKGTTSDLFRRVAMLLNGSREVENRPPRWWSVLTGAAFIGVAVLMSGIGLRSVAHADDGADEPKKDVIIRAHVVTDDGGKAEKKVLWLQADPKDEKRFILAAPEAGKEPRFVAVPFDAKGQKYIAVDGDGKRSFWVTAEPADGKKAVWVTNDANEGKSFRFKTPASADNTSRAWLYQAEPKGDKKAFIATTPADGKRVQVQDLGDGKRIIIIIDESESTKSDEKKPEPKKPTPVLKPTIVKPVERVFQRPMIGADAQKEAAEAVQKALEQLKKSGKEVDVDVRKALEEAVKRLEQVEKEGAFKKAGEAELRVREALQKGSGEGLRKLGEAQKEVKIQHDQAAAEYKKAMEAANKALQSWEEKTKAAVGTADRKARAAAVDAEHKAKSAAVEAEKKASEAVRHWKATTIAKPSGARLGVSVSAPGEALLAQIDLDKDQGLVIDQVMDGSAADKAGFKAHDILLAFNGKEVSSNVEAFVKAVQELKPGAKVDAVVLRKGKKVAMRGIVLAEAKTDEYRYVLPELQKDRKDLIDFRETELKKVIELKDEDLKQLKENLKDLDILVPKIEKTEKLKLETVVPVEKLKLERIQIKPEDVLEFRHPVPAKPLTPTEKIDPIKLRRATQGKVVEATPDGKIIELESVGPVKGEATIELTEPVLRSVIVDKVNHEIPVRFKTRTIPADTKERTVKITCERNSDDFTCKHEEANLAITVKGSIKDEKAAVKSIVIEANGKETKPESLSKVPDEYKERVKKLIELAEKGKTEFKIKD